MGRLTPSEKFFGGTPVAVEPPSEQLVAEVAGTVGTSLILAGVKAYERWLENPENVENEEWADMVTAVYAAMRAQAIALEAQIAADA